MKLLSSPLLFDYTILALFVCAAMRHIYDANLPKAMYWASAAVLNVSILMMGK